LAASQASLLVFFANKISPVIFSVFAIGELIADKLPFIPPRTRAGPLAVRVIFGALCGAALCFPAATPRRWLAPMVPDLVLALLEDLVAVGGGLFLVSR
jgi:uncharacterized membrane protein